jgi:hypothetical protein
VVQAVVDGVADVGIIADSTDRAAADLPFRQDHLVAVLSAASAGTAKSLAFSELLGKDFVGLSGDSALQQHSPATPPARAGACNLRAAAQLRWHLPHGGAPGRRGRCRRRRPGLRGAHGHRAIPLTDGWSRRQLLICVRWKACRGIRAN